VKGKRKMNIKRSPQPREIACAILIDTFGNFLLQQRDDVTGILHPGKVGLFGGHREGDETYLECVVREIHEEISLFVPTKQFEFLVRFDGTDMDVDGGFVHGEFFIARDIPVDALVVTEGSLLIVKADEINNIERRMTPSARFAMQAFLTGPFKRSF
jgi:8-oxo-dGTP diphosphatase